MMLSTIKDFLKLEAAGGFLLFIAAAVAMILANSPLSGYYDLFLDMPVEIRFGKFDIAKPLLLWINDGLMAVFFFLVRLELKREVLEGELSDLRNVVLPAFGAVGGMVVPAAIYVMINWGDAEAIKGWAIPAATDIAFALGILTLLGDRVPTVLKVFLVSLAIFDDMGAILIIALFYTSELSGIALLIAFASLVVLFTLNRKGVAEILPYAFIGVIMWTAVLKSGIHATLAGALLAIFIPIKDKNNPQRSPLCELEHDLHTVVAFAILPLFAFANAGIPFASVGLDDLLHPVPVGIAAGLGIGKQIGVFGFCWLAVKAGFAKLPESINWSGLYGVSMLCGVGFTMSLFIGSLAFEGAEIDRLYDERLGIVIGSLISAIGGYFILYREYGGRKQ